MLQFAERTATSLRASAAPSSLSSKFRLLRLLCVSGLVLASAPLRADNFYTVTPCRVFDSRVTPPPMQGGVERFIQVGGLCGVPAEAVAVSLNITVTNATAGGDMEIGRGSATLPDPATTRVSFQPNKTRANNGLIQITTDGVGGVVKGVKARAAAAGTTTVDLLLDVNGFFQPGALLTAGPTSAGFIEDGGPVVVDPAITVADPSSTTLVSATVTITNPVNGAAEVLAATSCGGLTVTPGLNSLSITGSASLATYITCLESVTYDNSSQDPTSAARNVSFVASDGISNSNTLNETVNVTPLNDAPVLTAGGGSPTFTEGDAPVVVDAGLLVTDVDNANLFSASVSIVSAPDTTAEVLAATACAGLTVTPGANSLSITGSALKATYQSCLRSVTYENTSQNPTAGARSIEFKVNDGTVDSNTASTSLTVGAVDDAPTAVADAATVSEDSSANAVDVLANDTDPDAGGISVASVTQPANGTVVITGGGTGLTYQPNANYCNTPPGTTLDTFTYTLTPGSSSTTVTMTVTCTDDAPVAVADSATVGEDDPATAVAVLANDTDIDAGPISITSVTQPANGAVVITGGGAGLTYQPNPNYCNTPPGTTPDTFTYTLTPGSSTATVSVTVNCLDDAPVAVADAATVNEDSGANAVNVLANDTDLDGGPISIQSVTQPANGAVVITGGGTGLTYAPNANYCNQPPGTTLDAFTYTLTPGGSSTTVTMTVTCLNDVPALDLDADDDKGTAGADFALTFTEGDPAKLIEDPADATVTDVDSPTLASMTVTLTNLFDAGFEILSTDVTGTSITAAYVTVPGAPGTGTLTLTGPDTVANFQTVLRKIKYGNTDTAPDETARVIQFVANDGIGNSNTATATVTVVAVDSPPVAVADSATVNEDSGASAVNVLANDTDADGGPKSIASVTQPTNGAVVITGGGTGLTYAPNANYCNSVSGPADTFTYTLTPGSSSTTVTMTVTCVDDNPVAVADAATVVEDSGANAVNVLANDTDADGGPKSIASVTQPANGVVVITGGGTGLTYAPNANYCNTPPGTTLDAFTYTLTPGSSSTTVTMTVTCVDDNPVAVADSTTVVEDSGANAVNVLANDTDVDGGPKSVASVTQPANGAVVITGGGTGLTYAPNANYCNTPPGTTPDTFTYTLTPGSSSTTVSVAVTCVNDPPTANADTADITEEAPNVPAANTVSGNVLTNDVDVDSSLTVSAVAGGSVGAPRAGTYGSVTINSNGSYTYTLDDTNTTVNGLAPGGTLTDPFGYTASDGSLTSSSTLTVTIHGADDPPTPDNDAFDFIGNTQLEIDRDTAATPEVTFNPGGAPELGVLDGDVDPDGGPAISISGIVGCGDLTAPFDCVIVGQGTVSLQANGSFSFVPEPGDTDPTASFQYTLTGNPNPATVTLTRFERVWFVDPNAGAGVGTSASPLNSLTSLNGAGGAGDSDVAGDYIFIHDGTLAGSIEMENNEHLLGEGVALTIPITGTFNGAVNPNVNLLAAGTQPQLTNASGDTVVIKNQIPIEIAGLSLASTTGNAIDLTSTAALTGSASLIISNNEIRGAGAEGVDVNLNTGTTGTLALNLSTNTWSLAGTHTGNAVDINRVAGTLNLSFSGNTNILSANGAGAAVNINGGAVANTTITGFSNNTVHGNSTGAGISISNVTFDAVAGGPIQQVDGDNLVIGATGNTVTGTGLSLATVQGNLFFDDLDVFGGTSALVVSGTGTGMTLAVTPASPDGSGTSELFAGNGAALDATSVALDLRLTKLTSTTSGSGVNLATTSGQFRAPSGSAISKSSGGGTAFSVASSSTTVDYGGTLNVTAGSGVSISGGAGAVNFSGQLTISTGANAAFAAAGGGTVTATATNSTLTTSSATALSVNGPDIGAGGLVFQSISVNGAGTGILLQDTGTTAGLTVSGTGTTAGSGGTIQNTSTRGASFINAAKISLKNMNFTNTAASNGAPCTSLGTGTNAGCNGPIHLQGVTDVTLDRLAVSGSANMGINARTVTNFALTNSILSGLGNEADENGLNFYDVVGTVSITNTSITGTFDDNIHMTQNSATTATITITGGSFSTSTQGTGIAFNPLGTSGAKQVISISGVTANNNFSGGIICDAYDTAGYDLSITTSTLTNNNDAIAISSKDGNSRFNIHDNTSFAGNDFGRINVLKAAFATAGTFEGAITGNPVVVENNRTTDGISVANRGKGILRALVANNVLTYGGTQNAISFAAGQDGTNAVFDITVTGNQINIQQDGTTDPLAGIIVASAVASPSGDGATTCADIGGAGALKNVYTHSGGINTIAQGDIRTRHRFPGSFRLPGYGGASGDTAAVVAYYAGRNTLVNTTPVATATDDGAGTGYTGGAACAQPSVP